MEKILMTVGVIVENEKILLVEKVEGLGAGKLNAPGGKYDPFKGDRNIDDTNVREPLEEIGINVLEHQKMGEIDFNFVGKSWTLNLHFYKINKYSGTPRTIEGADVKDPRWYDLVSIPYNNMWAADRIWLPMLLKGKQFGGKVLYRDPDNIVEHTIHEIE